jgi:hypothetical protein
LKVSINYKLIDGPWGGGNKFVSNLTDFLIKHGHAVSNILEKDTDIILIIDPRKNIRNITFSSGAIIRHLLFVNPKAIVVHRINECDERKGTKFVNLILRISNYVSDHTVFISFWLKNLHTWFLGDNFNIILNGANKRHFNDTNKLNWSKNTPLRIVTHHWSSNFKKGFDVYMFIDDLINKEKWRNRIEFTYIGNIPQNVKFKNTKIIPPLDTKELAKELKKHHIYISGSINEPCGNHQIEGVLSGLPVLFRESGGLPETCRGFGESFIDTSDFEGSLENIISRYDYYSKKLRKFTLDSDNMSREYLSLFKRLIKKRKKILNKRNFFRNPLLFLLNQVFF